MDKFALAAEIAGGASSLDWVITSGENLGRARAAWSSNVDSTIADSIICVGTCSLGLYMGGKIGHNIRVKTTGSLNEIGVRCIELAENLKAEKRKLRRIESETTARAIKGIIDEQTDMGSLNNRSRALIKEIKLLVNKYGD